TTNDLHSDIAKRVIAAILRCDLSLFISRYEMELLNSVFMVEPSLLHHLRFMVDLSALPKSTIIFDERE
ncbi:glycosyltransferase, partial [Pseudoalteromonas undina]